MFTTTRMQLLACFLRCKLSVEVVDVEVKITSMQHTHIFRRDWTTQLIKCTPWSTRLCPHPTIIKKMKTFLEVEGKMGPAPISKFRSPLPDTNPNIRKDNAVEKREQHPRGLGHQLLSLPLCIYPYQRPHQNPKMMYHIANPYLQFQFTRAHHGLVQVFEDINWLLPPNYLDNGNENNLENESIITTGVTSPKPPIKEEEEPKTNDQPIEKCSWGLHCPFCKSQEDKEEQNKAQQQKMSPNPK